MSRDRAKQREYKKQRYQRLKDDPHWRSLNRKRVKRYNEKHKEELKEKRQRPENIEKRNKRWDQTYHLKTTHNGYQYWYRGDKRLHRLIYERYVGPIPKGWDCHHKDHNTLRNCLSNLEIMPHGKHTTLHKLGEI